jgi:hypothetical protein
VNISSPQKSQEIGFLVIAERHPEIRLDPEFVVDRKKTTPSLSRICPKFGISELKAEIAQMTKNHFTIYQILK